MNNAQMNAYLSDNSFMEYLYEVATQDPNVDNVQNMTYEQFQHEMQNGARFVRFAYCYSVLVVTTHGHSQKLFFIKQGESSFKFSWKYILFSLFAGWWGFPFGFIFTPWALFVNLAGGKDVTQETLEFLQSQMQ